MIGAISGGLRLLIRSTLVWFPALQTVKERSQLRWQSAAHGTHERDFRAIGILDPPPRALYVDVGANIGQSVLSIRSQDRDARVVAFEPNPSLLDGLRRILPAGADVRIEPFALGDSDGSFNLYVPSYNGWVFHGLSSLDRHEAEDWLAAGRLIGFDRSRLVIEDLPCRVRRLDSFGLDPWLVKVDAQGMEAAVLAGGRETIARCEPILLLETTAFEGRIHDLLAPLGYSPAVLRDGALHHGDRGAMNIFYLPRRLTDLIRP
jgi:FkbM family methyltransferase